MQVILSEQTQHLLEARMKKAGFSNPDDAVRFALETLEHLDIDDLDDEALAAVEDGLAQANRGEGRPWEDVRAELRAKYLPK